MTMEYDVRCATSKKASNFFKKKFMVRMNQSRSREESILLQVNSIHFSGNKDDKSGTNASTNTKNHCSSGNK